MDFIQRLVNCGVQSTSSTFTQRTIKLTNSLTLTFGFMMIPYAVLFGIGGFLKFTFILVSLFLALSFVFVLNHRQKYNDAKFLLLFTTNLAVLIFSHYFGQETRIYLLFINLILSPSLLYSDWAPRSKSYFVLLTTIPIICFLWMEMYENPVHRLSGDILFFIRFNTYCTIFVGALVQPIYWIMINRQNESNLIRSERELRSSQQKLISLFNSMVEGMVIHDSSGKVYQYNAAALKILGVTDSQLLGKDSFDPLWKNIYEDGTPFPSSEIPSVRARLTGKIQTDVRMGISKPSGEICWITVNATPIFENEQDTHPEVMITFHDITERVKLSKESRLIRERLEIGMKAVRFGIWDWDMRHNALVWDDYMYEVFGVEKVEGVLTYDFFESVLVPESAKKLKSELDLTFSERRESFSSEFKIRRNDGSIRIIAAEARCFYDHQGIVRLVGANWDITDAKEQARQLIYHSKMSSLGTVSAGVAHEINNPLAIIKGKSQQIKRALSREVIDVNELAAQAQDISETVDRIAKITRGLLSFSRDVDNDPFHKIQLSEIISEAFAFCHQRFASHKVSLKMADIPMDLEMACRSSQLSQVLVNLLNNGIDATADLSDRWVKLDVQDLGEVVVISVTDSGGGVSKDIQEKIFEPFFTTKDVGMGTGLGLSICAGIIKAHYGDISIDQESPNTKFTLRIPKNLDKI